MKNQPVMTLDLSNYFEEYQKRRTEKVQYFHRILSSSRIDLFKLVQDAFDMTKEEASHKNPIFMNKNYMPNLLNGNMVGLAIERYGTAVVDEKYGRKHLALDKNLWIYLKKLDENYLPPNIDTELVKKINRQRLIDKDDEQIHALYVGPIVNDDWSDMKDSFVVCRNDFMADKTEWIEYLSKYKKSVAAPLIPMEKTKEEEENFVKFKKPDEGEKAADGSEK